MSVYQHKVQIIYGANKLKMKLLGRHNMQDVTFPPYAIRRAERELSNHDPFIIDQEMKSLVFSTISIWSNLKESREKRKQTHVLMTLHTYTNRILDLSLFCSFTLMTHFTQSLKIFLEHVDLDNPAHIVIIQAHVDVMDLAHQNKILTFNAPQAQHLKHTLQRAIEQNSD